LSLRPAALRRRVELRFVLLLRLVLLLLRLLVVRFRELPLRLDLEPLDPFAM
jgi:hypothetical protein